MNENIFRILTAAILLSTIGTSIYFRRKADRDTGEQVSSKDDNQFLVLVLRIGGLFLWFSPLIYAIHPAWMAWSKMGLPDAIRWAAGIVGFTSLGLNRWTFKSLGTGISPSVSTRREHKLVMSGPYRWIRHPLYVFATLAFLSVATLADSWFITTLAILPFVLLALRVPSEEAHLIEKFGDQYREYMKHTGRFFPRLVQSTTEAF